MITRIGSQSREPLAETEYEVAARPDNESVILRDTTDFDTFELWVKNNHHAGYTIDIDGIGYEYARRVPKSELVNIKLNLVRFHAEIKISKLPRSGMNLEIEAADLRAATVKALDHIPTHLREHVTEIRVHRPHVFIKI